MIRQAAAHVYSVAKYLGFDEAWRNSEWRRQRLLILCWHGISLDDEHQWRGGLYIPQTLFRQRLQYLASGGFTVLSLDEAMNGLWAGTLPPRSVAITFDDGFHDFAAKAVPVLKEFNFPATVYLTTYYVDHQKPVFNLIVSYMLWKKCGPGKRLKNGRSLANYGEAADAAASIISQADGLSGAQKDELARSVADELDLDYDFVLQKRLLHLMTADEVRECSATPGITFEAHTHRHRTPEDVTLMKKELRDNNRRIEEITGRRPLHFCYPSGVFRPEYFPYLENEGYASATTCELGIANRESHRFLVPRLLDRNDLSDQQYEGWLNGLYALGRRRAS